MLNSLRMASLISGFASNVKSGLIKIGTSLKISSTGVLDINPVTFANLADDSKAIPITATKTSAYTVVLTDIGTMIKLGAGSSVLIQTGSFSIGMGVSFYNSTSANILITFSSVTAYLSGVDTAKSSVNVLPKGIVTVYLTDTNICNVMGAAV